MGGDLESQVASLLASIDNSPKTIMKLKLGFYLKSLSCSRNRFKIWNKCLPSCLKLSS